MEKLHMQWDTIMNLDMYVFEEILESYTKILEERQKSEEDEMKKQGYDPNNMSADGMMKQAQKSMPAMPKMPNIQIPKF